MRNLLAGDPAGNRPKVLMLGISYPSVSGQMEEKGYEPDLLTNKTPSVDQSVEVVRRKIMTEMDGRDLARIVATEQACGIDAYTVSKEIGCVYRSDRHLHANFNARNFVQKLKESFGDDVQFSQVILDYYWMPTGWLVTRWAKTLFQKTLPNLVKERILTYPSTRGRRMRKKGDEIEEGVVYLPFCAHVCKELVGGIDTLKDYYSITFVKKSELPGHSLWKGTMDIDADTMQTRLGKRLDQEEVYCTFRPKDIYESMEDSHVSKPAVMRILMAIEDYENIRMIRLRPLRQHEPPSVLKERLLKPEIGGFKGLNFDLVNQKRKLAEEVAAAKAEKQKLEKQKKAVKVSSAKATSAPPKRKTEKQESAQPKKKAKETLKDKGPLYEEVEQLDACNIPHVTYFYPCPAIDLDTYNEPEEKRKASKKISQAKKPNEPEQQVFWIRQPLSKSPKKTTRSQKVLNLKKEPHKYLSYNPRCRKETNSEEKGGPGSAVLEITVPYVKTLSLGDKLDQERELFLQRERELDSNQTLVVDGACTLFDLRNNVSSISSSQVQEGEQQLTCIKIPREDLLGRLENEMNFEKEHPQEEDDVPLFQAAVEASRGDWDAVNSSMLSKSDKEGLESTKRRFESNKKDVMKKYKERLQGDPKARKPFQEDRCLHLDNIVRWIFCRRDESLDPTGEFRTIDAEVLQRPKEQLWLRAKLLEVRLHAKHRLEYSTDDKSPHEEHSSSKKVINLEEQQEEMQHFQEDRITVDNGKWDDVLSDEDQIQLVELKRKFRLNVKDAFRKYKKKLGDDLKARKPFLGDRCLDLDHIVRWICGGKNRSDDPTGKFHSIDDGLSPSSNKPLWKRAKEIEARLRSSRIKKSNAEQASLQKTVAHVVDDFCDADIASEMGYNKEELKMYKDVMCWLQDRQDVYDPTGEFSDIDKKLEKSVFEDTESKAKEMVSRICIMRRLFGDWLGIGSADGKPAASPGRRKQSKATTKKIVSPSDKLHRDALRWLKKKTEKNDPTGEFCDIDSRLPPSDNQGISDRARDMVVRIELLRTCLGEWLQQQSDETASGEAKVSEISGATKNMRSSPRKAIGEEDKKRLESLKNRFKSNVKDDLKKYQMRLKKNPNARKPFKGDRGLDLDNIVNWICCGKKQSADPTGEFRSFDTEIPPSPYKPLWSRAMEIERGLRKMKMRKFLQECQDMQHPREDHDTAADHMIADQSLPNEIEQKQEKQHPREDHYTIDCGKWDKVLGDKDMRRLKTLKKKFDWNEKEALRKYNIKLKNNPEARRKSFHGDRWLDLSRILNWICGGGKESDDPTGEFRSIDAEISPSPHEPLWSRARDIERELRSFHVKKHKAQFKEHPQRGHDAIADQSPPNKAIARDEEKHETQHPQEDHDMAADHMIDDHSSPMEVEQKYEKQHPQRGGDKIADRSPPNKAIARDEEKHETQHPQEDHDTVADHMIAERSFPKEVEHKHEKQHPQRGHGTISDQSSTNKVITRDDEKNGTQHAQENHESAADHMIDEQSSTKEVEQKQEKQHPREDHYTTKSGKWDNVLGDEGKAYLMEWQQRFEKNCRDATRLYEKKLKQNPEARQPFQGDRLLDLNCIVNWICGGKNKSDDPTGEFCSIDAEISPSPEEPIWIRAKDIETKLRLLRVKKYHKELSQKESSETERKGKKNQTSPSLAKRPRTNQSEESTSDNPSNKNQISSRQVKKPRTDTIELAADNPVAFSPVEFAGSADQLLANLVVHARLFQQLGVSKEEYQMFLQDYRDKYGLGRCSALNSICGWLALDDPSLDQTGEFRMLHGIFSPSPRSPILDRAIQLEVLLYGLRLQPWGDDWTENPSAATLYVRGSLARWEREGYRNAIPPVCVSPSPPNSLYEGFAGRAILEMQAQLQRHVPSTPVIRPKTDSPIGGTTLSPAVAFARTNVPWVTVQKDSGCGVCTN